MPIPHGDKCFCDNCIARRTADKVAARDRKKDADAYVKRRGGTLENPAPSQAKKEKI